MQTITKYLVLLILSLNVQLINAQDSIPAIKNRKNIEMLEKLKITIQEEERNYLKEAVIEINKRLENNEITAVEAENLKKEAATLHALNIENRIAIVDNKIALFKRNDYGLNIVGKDHKFGIVVNNKPYTITDKKSKPKKYDKRTSNDFVLAIGINNAIVEGDNLDNSPYKFGGSRFLELGWAWKTRVFDNSNFVRFKYGYSLHINGFKPKDNKYFVQQDSQTVLETFPENLRKSKLTVTNLVFPMHFEFGPSKKIDKETYFRYSTHNKFKIGVGGYAGFNLGARQKLKYKIDGKRFKDKQKHGFNTTNLVYGLSAYAAINNTALYVKYDLSPVFKDQLVDQNNISIGVRFDMD